MTAGLFGLYDPGCSCPRVWVRAEGSVPSCRAAAEVRRVRAGGGRGQGEDRP